MNLLRLRFVHRKNIDEIGDIGVAQSFQIGESGFHQRDRLLFA